MSCMVCKSLVQRVTWSASGVVSESRGQRVTWSGSHVVSEARGQQGKWSLSRVILSLSWLSVTQVLIIGHGSPRSDDCTFLVFFIENLLKPYLLVANFEMPGNLV